MGERTSYEPGTPCWADLSTPDLDGALRFYGGLFGWEFEDAGEETGHHHQALVRGKRVAGLGPAQDGAPPVAYWMTYLCGTDADEHASAIKDASGTVEFGPLEILGQGRMVVGQDPTGAMFGIWEPQEHKGAQLVNENATLCWNELLTRDVEGAARFYGVLFGFTFENLPETAATVYQVLRLGDQFVGGIGTLPEGTPADVPPYWLTYFHLDDVDAGFERVRELGGELLGDPIDSPYGRLAPVRDPQGSVFALIRAASPVP